MKLIRDTRLIFMRSMQITLRNPVWIMFGLFQPLCFLLLFAPLLDKLISVQGFGVGSSLTIFVPGLLVMIALYGTAFVGFGLIDDIRSGVIERFKVTPINRVALLLGRTLRDIVVLLVQVTFLMLFAWVLGLSVPLAGVALSFALIVLIGFSISVTSYSVAMILQNEDAFAPFLNFFLLPLQLLAGITLPLTLAPNWLQKVALFNPLAHAVSAARSLFVADYFNTDVFLGFGAMFLAVAVAYHFSSNLFKKAEE